MAKFKRLNAGERPTASDWNNLCAMVENLAKITGTAPLAVRQIGGVPIVSLHMPAALQRAWLVRVDSAGSGRGSYVGSKWRELDEPPVDGALDDGMIGNTEEDQVIIWNTAETVAITGGPDHILTTDARPLWFVGFLIGYTVTEEGQPDKEVYAITGNQDMACPPAEET